jgi:hypothetical protein
MRNLQSVRIVTRHHGYARRRIVGTTALWLALGVVRRDRLLSRHEAPDLLKYSRRRLTGCFRIGVRRQAVAKVNGRTEFGDERVKKRLIRTPSADRFGVNRPTHLNRARRPHLPLNLVECQTTVIPIKTAVRDDSARLRLKVADELFVLNVQPDVLRQYLPPMLS